MQTVYIFIYGALMLLLVHAPWSFGKKVAFMWGDDHLETCEDKWTFVFVAKRRAQVLEHGTQSC